MNKCSRKAEQGDDDAQQPLPEGHRTERDGQQ